VIEFVESTNHNHNPILQEISPKKKSKKKNPFLSPGMLEKVERALGKKLGSMVKP
jgi:hypothetical protein